MTKALSGILKKYTVVLLVLVGVYCVTMGAMDWHRNKNSYTFHAVAVEHGGHMIFCDIDSDPPTLGSLHGYSLMKMFNAAGEEITYDDIQLGDLIRVTYSGWQLISYPVTFWDVYTVELLGPADQALVDRANAELFASFTSNYIDVAIDIWYQQPT